MSEQRLIGQTDDFATAVRPVLADTCAQCHNSRLLSGGLNVELTSPQSLVKQRDVWEKVCGASAPATCHRRARPGRAKPQLDAMTGYIERAFDRADASIPQDPGHVTARRLDRTEYTKTILDLLGVRFRAEKYFPADDSGDGFDNIADVLTVSPAPDRALSGSRGANRQVGDLTGIRRSRSRSTIALETGRFAALIAAPSKPNTGWSSPATTRCASACQASGRR